MIDDKKTNTIIDIQILMNGKQRNAFLAHFPQKNLTRDTACYTSLAQNELAKFNASQLEETAHTSTSRFFRFRQRLGLAPSDEESGKTKAEVEFVMKLLWECTETFADLEALINRPGNLANLNDKLEEWNRKIHLIIHQWYKKRGISHAKWYQQFLKKITDEQCRLTDHIKFLQTKTTPPPISHLRQIFGVQDHDHDIPSLGALIANQYETLFDEGILQLKAITQSRVVLHPAVRTISNFRAALERKAKSLHGARYNNGRDCIPDETIETIRHFPDTAENKWVSINPYVSDPNQIEDVDKVFCYIEGSKDSIHVSSWSIFPASVIEFGLTLLRIPVAIISFIVSLGPASVAQVAKDCEKGIAEIHRKYSLVSAAKNLISQDIAKKLKKTSRRELLEQIKSNPESLYSMLATEYLSGHQIAAAVKAGFWRIFNSILNLYKEPNYLLNQVTPDARKNVITAIHKRLTEIQQKILTDLASAEAKYGPHSASLSPLKEEKSELKNSNALEHTDLLTPPEQHWASPKPWVANEMVSVFDFGDDILSELSAFIDSTFRLKPGPATGCFMLANGSLATLALPGFAAKLGGIGHILEVTPKWLAQKFTGSAISEGLFPKIVSVFLEWKIGFLLSELTSETLGEAKFEFLKELFPEAEKVTLGILALALSGWNLQFLPTINFPTTFMPYAPIINMLSEEARKCSRGTVLLNSLEYIFLGLKANLLVKALLTGKHDPQIETLDIKKLTDELREANILALENKEQQREQINRILIQHGIPEPMGSTGRVFSLVDSILAKLTSTNLEEKEQAHPFMLESTTLTGPQLNVANAWLELTKALTLIDKMGALKQSFESKDEAKSVYDHLYFSFEAYDKALVANGQPKLQASDSYLDEFYNRYVHEGSLSIVKITSIFPFYPLTLVWRAFKYMLAVKPPTPEEDAANPTSALWRIARFVPRKLWQWTRHLFTTTDAESPAVAHQIKKSFAKEGAMLIQLIASASLILRAAARAVAYIARFVIALVGFIVSALFSAGMLLLIKEWRDAIMDGTTVICPHKASFTAPLRPLYARLTHIAGTNSAGLNEKSNQLLEKLVEQKPVGITEWRLHGTAKRHLKTAYSQHDRATAAPTSSIAVH
jgi:hypothetical protein